MGLGWVTVSLKDLSAIFKEDISSVYLDSFLLYVYTLWGCVTCLMSLFYVYCS